MHRQSVLASLIVVAGIGLVTPGMAQAQSSAQARSSAQAPGSIAALQRQLRQAGYDPGPIDGVVSDKTRAAIAAYERATGRAPDGLPGDPAADAVANAQATLRRLGFLAQAPDGVVGPQTRTAIIRFETTNHLPVDPRVGDRLLAALQQASARATAAPPALPPRVPLPPGVTPPPIPAPTTAPATAALPPGVTPPPIAPPANAPTAGASSAAGSQAALPPAVPPPASAAATPQTGELGRQPLPAGVSPPPIH